MSIYYVQDPSYNVNASDNNAGTNINYPWATWQKAFTSSSVGPGDTVYFRGGIYYMPVMTGEGITITRNGSDENNIIQYFAYPEDWAAGNYPILDCDNVTPISSTSRALYGDIEYIHFKGLHVRNVSMLEGSNFASGWINYGPNHVTWENCVVYNIDGEGFNPWDGVEVHYINCDVYNCCDWLDPINPGNSGSGFHVTNTTNFASTIYYYGCRAWNCGDQGWAVLSPGYIEIDNCWSFHNGILAGGGHGFKLGWQPQYPTVALQKKMVNCIATWNRATGITTNDNDLHTSSMNIYNNFVYKNWDFSGDYPSSSRGIVIYGTLDESSSEYLRVFKNNISYANDQNAGDLNISVESNASYNHEHNSWDIPISVSDCDFINLDVSQLYRPRKADFSLPDISFGHLTANSSLIGAGIYLEDVSTDAEGNIRPDPPSLGPYEYEAPPVYTTPTVTTSAITNISVYTATGGGNVTDDGSVALTYRGVCWGTSLSPTATDTSTTDETTGEGSYVSYLTGLSASTHYYVRAFAYNSQGISYGTDVSFNTLPISSDTSIFHKYGYRIGNTILTINGKMLTF